MICQCNRSLPPGVLSYFSNSVLWSCQHRTEISATYLLGKSLLGRVRCGWKTGPDSIWRFLTEVSLTEGSWLWLEHCVFWLNQLADKFPGTPGRGNESSLRLHSDIQESLGHWHWDQNRAQPSVPPQKPEPAYREVLVPRLLHKRESCLYRTVLSVSLPNPTGDRVQCYSCCWW